MVFSINPSRKSTRSLLVSLLAFASIPSLSVQAATVTLDNGDQITGEVRRLTDSTLTFKSSVFGEVTIPWGSVKTLVANENVRIQLNDGTSVDGKLVLNEDGTVTIDEGRTGQTNVLSRQELAALNPPIVDPSMKYSGRLDFGGTFNRGNSQDDQLNVNGELVARTPRHRYTLGVEVNEARSAQIKTTSNRRLLTQYDTFLNEKDYLFATAKLESDELADLDLRTSLGAGYGRQFIDTDISQLSGQVGVNYVKEDFTSSPGQSFPSLSLGMKYDRKFFDEKLAYFQHMNMDVSLDDAEDTLLRTRLGVRMPIAQGVNVSTQLNVDYDFQPALGKKKMDTGLIFSVGYGF